MRPFYQDKPQEHGGPKTDLGGFATAWGEQDCPADGDERRPECGRGRYCEIHDTDNVHSADSG